MLTERSRNCAWGEQGRKKKKKKDVGRLRGGRKRGKKPEQILLKPRISAGGGGKKKRGNAARTGNGHVRRPRKSFDSFSRKKGEGFCWRNSAEQNQFSAEKNVRAGNEEKKREAHDAMQEARTASRGEIVKGGWRQCSWGRRSASTVNKTRW